jgi:hypothetical protein
MTSRIFAIAFDVRHDRSSYPKFPHDESRSSVDRLPKNHELFRTDPWISSPNLTPEMFLTLIEFQLENFKKLHPLHLQLKFASQ